MYRSVYYPLLYIMDSWIKGTGCFMHDTGQKVNMVRLWAEHNVNMQGNALVI